MAPKKQPPPRKKGGIKLPTKPKKVQALSSRTAPLELSEPSSSEEEPNQDHVNTQESRNNNQGPSNASSAQNASEASTQLAQNASERSAQESHAAHEMETDASGSESQESVDQQQQPNEHATSTPIGARRTQTAPPRVELHPIRDIELPQIQVNEEEESESDDDEETSEEEDSEQESSSSEEEQAAPVQRNRKRPWEKAELILSCRKVAAYFKRNARKRFSRSKI